MTLPRLLTLLLTSILAAAFWWQGERFLTANGPTFDEPVHFAAGYSYWATGDFRLNHEDPPLAKLLWALPQYLFDPIPFRDEWRTANEWRVGHAMLFDSGHDWQSLLTPARRMNLLFGVGVVVLVGVFARRLFDSPAAGVTASALAAFDPNLVAHSCILSTDVALTFCTLLVAWRGWEVLKPPPPPTSRLRLESTSPTRGEVGVVASSTQATEPATPHLPPRGGGRSRCEAPDRVVVGTQHRKILLLGLAVGLALGAKFSAVLVVLASGAGLLAAVAAGAVVAMPGVLATPATFGDRVRLAVPVVLRVAFLALLTLLPLYFFVRFQTWGEGLKYQLLRGDSGDASFFLLGEVSGRGWLWYFAVALAVKLPVGLLGLAVFGLASGGRIRPSDAPPPASTFGLSDLPHEGGGGAWLQTSPQPNDQPPNTSPLVGEVGAVSCAHPPGGGADPSTSASIHWFLPVFALTLFVLISLSKVDLGVRVVLPVVPFAYLLAAGFVARPGLWRKVIAAIAVASVIVSALRASPYPLSYFNEFVGGPERGIRILGDSNVDWGQGLPALKEYMVREGLPVVALSYCGTAPPRAFGIRCEPLVGNGALEPPIADDIPPDGRRVIVVSASSLQGLYLKDREAFAWLRNRTPITILAGCLWVFEDGDGAGR